MKSLLEIYEKYQYSDGHGDKGTAHSYIEVYEELFNPYRFNSTILEIGLAYGESFMMWREYFIDSTIIGVDISDEEISVNFDLTEEKNIIICDATDEKLLDYIGNYKFDIIIDDGSHILQDQIKTFHLLKKLMKKNGIYVIEDVNNIDTVKDEFLKLHTNCKIIDLRHIKNRYDDVLVVYQF